MSQNDSIVYLRMEMLKILIKEDNNESECFIIISKNNYFDPSIVKLNYSIKNDDLTISWNNELKGEKKEGTRNSGK